MTEQPIIRPSDLLSTALEAGFGWFHGVRNEERQRYLDALDAFDAGTPVEVRCESLDDPDATTWVRVTPAALLGAVGTLARFRVEKWGWSESGIPRDRSEWDFDACDADAVLQIAVYGDTIFG